MASKKPIPVLNPDALGRAYWWNRYEACINGY
jgi:hypothetical protein